MPLKNPKEISLVKKLYDAWEIEKEGVLGSLGRQPHYRYCCEFENRTRTVYNFR
jgi:hypothetical protein